MTEQGKETFTIACLGDVVARPGRAALRRLLPAFRASEGVDLVIANGENSSGGTGIDPTCAREIFECGVDLITLGDHVWRRREAREYLEREKERCIRPSNFAEGAPGCGWTIADLGSGVRIGVMNLLGRTFIGAPLDCPFREARRILNEHLSECSFIICDFHAEATSEKYAMARYLDGDVGVLFGTHTHVQTADEQLLPGGTAYISDLGMCGSPFGVIGMDADTAVDRFLSGIPSSYKAAKGEGVLCGIVVTVSKETWKAIDIRRLRLV